MAFQNSYITVDKSHNICETVILFVTGDDIIATAFLSGFLQN